MKKVTSIVAVMVLLFAAFSCKQSRVAEPSTEFATYVKAYTGGMVSASSSVKVELTGSVPADATVDGLFTFSPSVKGEAHWISSNMAEFVPESLKPGTTYNVTFNLGKVMDVEKSDLKKFNFSFYTAPKAADVSIDAVQISASDETSATVRGTVTLSEPLDIEKVRSALKFKYSGSGSPTLTVEQGETPASYTYEVSPVVRGGKAMPFTITFDGHKEGFTRESVETVNIPENGVFEVISTRNVTGADPYVEISFSQPLDASQDLRGLASLTSVGRSYSRIEDNIVRLYYDECRSSSLRVEVSGNVLNFKGERLGAPAEYEFTETDIAPAVKLAFEGNILPDSKDLSIPFKSVNLAAVDVSVIKIYESNVLMFLQSNSLDGSDELRRSGRLVYRTTLRLDSDPDLDLHEWQNFSIDLGGLLTPEAGAIYRIRFSFKQEYSLYKKNASISGGDALVSVAGGTISAEDQAIWDTPYPYVYENFYDWELYNWDEDDDPTKPSYYMLSYRFPEENVIISNIGVVAKYSGSDRIWVNVNDILTTKPISGAEVTAYNYQLAPVGTAKTDGDGLCTIQLSGKPFAVVVRSGDQVGYLKVTDGEEKSLSRFDTGGQTLSSGLKGFIYGERGVWRPGDTLHVSIMIEDRDNIVPDTHPVTMELYNPQGQFHSKMVNAKGTDGLYVFNIPTSAQDPTGTWNAYFKVGGATFHKSLPIETIKPNRIKIALTTDDILSAGQNALFNVNANWLTGPAAANLKVVSEMSLSRRSAGFKGWEGFNFNDPVSSFSTTEYTLFEKTLSDKGAISVNVKMPDASSAPGMLNARISTRVLEQGGDASIVSQSALFAPFSAFVGVKTGDGSFETDQDLKFPVIVVDKTGKAVSGHRLEYRIYKLDWSWWWESSGESLDSYVNGRGATPVASGTLNSGTSAVDVPFRINYPDWGRYLVYVKDKTGGHASGGIVYVDWPSWRGASDKKDPENLTMLTFSTDKKEYAPGDEVTVYIPSAEDGRALVSLENGRGVIDRFWVSTGAQDQTKFTFKVTADMAPNFYIHITLLQKHQRVKNDLPIRMYGVQPVMVTDQNSHLSPEISLPDVLRPQEEFSVKVSEKNGRPMTYTLAIVDEGLLDITSFKTPDPWASMYAREALGVRTWDLYDRIFGAYSGKFSPVSAAGGDVSVDAGAKKDNRFNPVVAFYGPFTLQKGTHTHKIQLPMYVGSVRVMVVAGKDAAYGNAEKAVPVRSPLMILPTLPRVISTGEKVTLPVNVFAMESGVKNVSVKVNVEGPLKANATSSSLVFDKTGDQICRFPLTAGNTAGMAKVTITATDGTHEAKETINIEVRNPNPVSSHSWARMLAKGEEVTYDFQPFAAEDGQYARYSLSNFPAVDFNSVFDYLEKYPYNCAEQICARGISLIAIKQFLTKEDADKVDALVEGLLKDLYTRQLPDGGFCYWPGATVADEWVSSMAGEFMATASQKGYQVSKSVYNNWKKFQSKSSAAYRHTDKYAYYDLTQAYRLYTLALSGKADEAAMNRLKSVTELTSQARWRLAAAYALNGKKNIAKQLLGSMTTEITDASPYTYTYGSSRRDKAMMLETACLLGENNLAMSLAEEVASAFENQGYVSQDLAFSAVALSRLASLVGGGTVQGEVDGSKVKSAASVCTGDIDPAKGTVTVKNTSDGPLYACVMTRSQNLGAQEAAASGIALSVRYTDMNGKDINPASIRQGTDFKAVIVVTNNGVGAGALTNLALQQIIPSGWEIYNERLFGGAADTVNYSYQDIRDDRVLWYFDLPAGARKSFTVRLQAAYEGTFFLPSVSCEAMYDGTVWAHTASAMTTVVR